VHLKKQNSISEKAVEVGSGKKAQWQPTHNLFQLQYKVSAIYVVEIRCCAGTAWHSYSLLYFTNKLYVSYLSFAVLSILFFEVCRYFRRFSYANKHNSILRYFFLVRETPEEI
jgi:hypothetical protein